MQAKIKATGEIIEVRAMMGCNGDTTWLEDATDTEYYPDELDFSPIKPSETIAPLPSISTRYFRDMRIYMAPEVVEAALKLATDKQLRIELKRRVDERKALRSKELRCRNCKHCIEGYTSKRSLDYGCKTSVCSKKPKFQCEAYGLYYATCHTQKACDMFELK